MSADLALAAGLFVLATIAVAATCDMGFVRDEAFYFRHSETYQDWFTDVLADPTDADGDDRDARSAADEALSRKATLKAWRNNAEHPPLSKIAMGFSWRLLGRKLRPVARFSAGPDRLNAPSHTPGKSKSGKSGKSGKTGKSGAGDVPEGSAIIATVRGLGRSHGFAVGSEVTLLAPQVVGKSASPRGRELLVGTVTSRQTWRAKVQLAGGVLQRINQTCVGPGKGKDGVMRRTGCEVVENRALYWLSESEAMRFPGAVFAGLMVALMFLAARGRFLAQPLKSGPLRLPIPFALLASAGFLLLPRAFYHAHLAVFDMAICALLVATTCAYQRSLRRRRWVWIVAILWGLSLLAKHNAAFLPVVFIGHWLWDGVAERRIRWTLPAGWRRWAWLGGAAVALVVGGLVHPLLGLAAALIVLAGRGMELDLPPLPRSWFVMLPVGLLLVVAGWPLLWHDTFDNFLRWLEFHLGHEHYMQQYFGAILAYPPFPWGFPWVTTALTWPVAMLAATCIGVIVVFMAAIRWHVTALRGTEQPQSTRTDAALERRSWMRLIMLSALWPTALISLPSTPVFGGIKHWMPSYPWMLLLGAIGCWWVWRVLTSRFATSPRVSIAAAWLLTLAIVAPGAQATWEVHPHGTAYYNELIGGPAGAADAGMQRQFWGGATREGLAEVNRRAPDRARIWFHKAAWGAFMMYQREGWFRRDLSYGNDPSGTSHGFYHHQKDHDDYELECMKDYKVAAPVMRASIEGVPLLSVYERDR